MYPHKDQFPFICRAGQKHKSNWNVADCLTDIRLQDKVEAVIGPTKKESLSPAETKLSPMRYAGVHTAISDVISPPTISGYKMLLHDLGETTYDSYWNKCLGNEKNIYGRSL